MYHAWVALQSRDVPFELDAIALLDGIPGKVAARFSKMHRAMLSEDDDRPPLLGRASKSEDVQFFIDVCSGMLESTKVEAQRALGYSGLVRCAELAILGGQFEQVENRPTASPNAFSYELEWLASVCAPNRVMPSTSWSRRRPYQHALDALRAARMYRVLNFYVREAEVIAAKPDGGLLEHTKQLGSMSQEEWISLKGKFVFPYDWQFSAEIANQLRSEGFPHPDIRVALTRLLGAIVEATRLSILRFREEVMRQPSGPLQVLVKEQTLISRAGSSRLSKHDLRIVSKFGPAVWVDVTLLGRGGENIEDVARWLSLLTLDPKTCGQNTKASALFDSPLAHWPLIYRRGAILPTLVHAISTDLSFLLERKLANLYGEAYYVARAKSLEQLSVSCITNLMPDADWLLSAKYSDGKSDAIEVDGIVVWHDICIIVEAKGGFLRLNSRQGDVENLKSDLKGTVGDGFFQGLRLMRTLDSVGSIELVGKSSSRLRLDKSSVRRFYVVIPTADAMGTITTWLQQLWSSGVLPDGAVPLVIPVQDLALMSDLLSDGLDFVSYLEYREEIIALRSFYLADELEILGAFVGGQDVIGRVQHYKTQYSGYSAWRADYDHARVQINIIDPDLQETFIDPWIRGRSTASITGRATPDPPRRHNDAVRTQLRRLLDSRGGTAAAAIADNVDREVLNRIGDHVGPVRRRNGQLLMSITQTALIYYVRGERLSEVRRRTRRIRSEARLVVYISTAGDRLEITGAERGGLSGLCSTDASKDVLSRSRVGDSTEWYSSFSEERRRRAKANLTSSQQNDYGKLVLAGLDLGTAIGVVRRGLYGRVKGFIDLGIPSSFAADFWLRAQPGLREAEQLSNLDRGRIYPAVVLYRDGKISGESLREMLIALARESDASMELLLARLGPSEDDVPLLVEALRTALDELELTEIDIESMGEDEKLRKRNAILGMIRRRLKNPDMRRAVAVVDEALGL